MSGIRSSDPSKAAIGIWQKRGEAVARAGHIARPPAIVGAASAYMDGYLRIERRKKR